VDRAWRGSEVFGYKYGSGIPVDVWWYEECRDLPWLAPSGMSEATYKKKYAKVRPDEC